MTHMSSLEELEAQFEIRVVYDGFEPFIPVCCGCKHYFTVTEEDGWEGPSYSVPMCDRPEGRGPKGSPRLEDDGSIRDWMVGFCRHRRVK